MNSITGQSITVKEYCQYILLYYKNPHSKLENRLKWQESYSGVTLKGVVLFCQ